MSEKRNLVHWSILALRDCKLPLTSVRHFFTICINAFCKFSFAYYSFIGSPFWQFVSLFLLLIIRQRTFLPVFAKMTTDTELPARRRRKPFPLSVIQKTRKWQPGRQKNFPVHSKTPPPCLFCQKWAQKKQQIFFKTYCFMCCRWAAGYSVLGLSGSSRRNLNRLSISVWIT